jgi:RNA polymerase sigma-70 factor (ECF subfamily)
VCPPSPRDQEIRTHLDEKRYTEAFELVMAQYQHKVFRLAFSMLGNQALAEETAQDVFVRVWRALAGYRGLASISTWIFAIARNACLSARRSRSGRPTVSLDEPAVRVAAEASGHTAPHDELREPDLARLIARLPEKHRQVITLFYMEEKSYAEVARLLDLPMGTVKTHLHRAKKELAEAILRGKMPQGGR